MRIPTKPVHDSGTSRATVPTFGTSAGSYNIGQLAGISMSGSGYSEALNYDSVGRLSRRSINPDNSGNDLGSAYYIDLSYNNQGLLDILTYPTSTASTRVKVKYGYAYGILDTVTDWTSGSAGTVYWTANAQNPRGQTTQDTLGNGIVTHRAIDAVTGWTSSIQSGVSGGAARQNQGYLYDLVGNVTQRQESNLGLTENFYYDDLYRLSSSTLNASPNLSISYDATGNILTRSDVNGGATWTYDTTKKHAVKTTGSGGYAYSYDANGNMTSRNGAAIGWASYNYPTSLSTASESTTFSYGPDRQYYEQVYAGSAGTETTHYIGGLLEKVELPSSTTDWRHTIIAEGQTVAIVSRLSTGTNAVSYPLEDHQGSGAVLTDSSGAAIVKESFNAFGLPRNGSTWSGAVPAGDQMLINGLTRRGYTFHSMLGDMGLIHMNGRVQDAVTGRFLSPDQSVPHPEFTQSFNRYSYVNNNPLSFTDPSGFEDTVLSTINVFGSRQPPPPSLDPNTLCSLLAGMLHQYDLMGAPCSTVLNADFTQSYGGGGGGGGGTSAGSTTSQTQQQQQKKTDPKTPQGDHHEYTWVQPTMCSADDTFAAVKNTSAPGAPPATDGFTNRIMLFNFLFQRTNPIDQSVDPSTRTIVNTTRPGHRYYPGSVTIHVEPTSADSSNIIITGVGDGPHATENKEVGEAWFGVYAAGNIARGCSATAGAYYVAP